AGRGGIQAGRADLHRHRDRRLENASFPMDRRSLGQPASLGDRRAGDAGPGSGAIALTVTQIRITVERTGQADHEARGVEMLDKERAVTAALGQIERIYGTGAIMKLGQAAAPRS